MNNMHAASIPKKEYTNMSQQQKLYAYSMNKQYVDGVQNG